MRYALFLGCTTPARLPQYEASCRAVLGSLEVELVDIEEFNCCGYPLRNTDIKAAVLASARNLALAQRDNLPVLVLCKCGFGMLKYAASIMEQSPSLKEQINTTLSTEGLEYRGGSEIRHLLSVLYHDIGIDTITEKITKPYKALKVATHYGCHALRPSEIVHFDDPVNPTLFDRLVAATGAESISWQKRLDCCGAPLLGVNDALSMDLMDTKLSDARQAGADFICDACPYCHIQFDTVQRMLHDQRGGGELLAPILYPQLLGLCLGIDGKSLGLAENTIDITSIEGFLSG
jgi:heterodisulfide reductase subunit B